MSQKSNRFSVLSLLSDSNNNPIPTHQPLDSEPLSENSNMSLNGVSPAHSSSVDSAFPERVHIRSARLKFSTHIQVQIKTLDTRAHHELQALLDSGATGLFLSTSFVEKNNLNTRKLPRAFPVYNATRKSLHT